MKGKALTAVACLVALVGLVAYVHNARSAVAVGEIRVACLKSGDDIGGSDQMLQNVAHVAHTPAEGGRCYFKFNAKSVSPNIAPQMLRRFVGSKYVTYPSANAGYSRVAQTQKIKDLFNKLKSGTGNISRSSYGVQAPVYNNWNEVKAYLDK